MVQVLILYNPTVSNARTQGFFFLILQIFHVIDVITLKRRAIITITSLNMAIVELLYFLPKKKNPIFFFIYNLNLRILGATRQVPVFKRCGLDAI